MRYTLTPAQMREAERRLCEALGLPEAVLMERAALHAADAARRLTDGRAGRALVLCGPGGNGGDGLATARLLAAAGLPVTVWRLPGDPSPLCAMQLQWLSLRGGVDVQTLRAGSLPRIPADTAVIVDALFGTGLDRPLSGLAAALCGQVNERALPAPVLALDIPSGVNGADGSAPGGAVRASETVCFHALKTGLLLGEGPNHTGRVTVCDIGLPDERPDGAWLALEPDDLPRLLPHRARATHKGDYGRLLVWAGSEGMAGAAAICATAALRTGVGLCTVACPREIVNLVQQLAPCATCLPLPMDDPRAAWALLEPALRRADALACGCGLGQSKPVELLLTQVFAYLRESGLPAVMDADALNVLARLQNADADDNAAPYRLHERVALTPHPVEAARLLGRASANELPAPEEALRQLRERYGASVVYKGAHSLMAAEGGRAVNLSGAAAMAKGGSGDALTGVLGALLAGNKTYGLEMLPLLQVGCYLHGEAGERAARRAGERGLLATELAEELGRVE